MYHLLRAPFLLTFLLLCLPLARVRADAAPCSTEADPKVFLQKCWDKAHAEEQAGRPAEALAIYQQAFKQVPTPRLLWPIANLHLRLGHPQEGLRALGRYSAEIPAEELSSQQREEAVKLRRDLHDLEKQQDQKGSKAVVPPVTPPPELGLKAEPGPPIAPRFRAWKWVTLGAGIALIGAGAGVWAVDGRPTCNIEPVETQCQKILSTTPFAIPLVSIGAAALVTSGVMFVLDFRRRPHGN